MDAGDNLYVLSGMARIVRISADGSVRDFAGTGEAGLSGDGGPASSARISAYRIAVDPNGILWMTEPPNNRIRKVDRDGIITTIAEGDGAYYITADGSGTVYFAPWDQGQVWRIPPGGRPEVFAGVPYRAPYRGDGGPATAAALLGIQGLAADSAGNFYIAESKRLRRVDRTGVIRSVAGCVCAGDGGPVWAAQVGSTAGLVRDAAGNVYYSDQESQMVRRIAMDGTLTTIAGTGESGFSGDGGPAREAGSPGPRGWPSITPGTCISPTSKITGSVR